MKSPHVVFVDSTLAGLLAFKTARRMNLRVTFIEPLDSSFLPISTSDASRIQPHLAYVHHHIKLPTLAGDALTDTIRSLRQTGSVDAVITTSEAAILAVAKAAEDVGLHTPGYGPLQTAVFKDRCRAALRQSGLYSPKFEVMTETELLGGKTRTIRAPLVVKPTRGFGKQFSAVCKTEVEFDAFVATLSEVRSTTDPMINLIVNNQYILEEYVAGTLHSAEVVVVGGELRFFATTTRYRASHNDLLEMGYSMPAGLQPDKLTAMEAYVRDVFQAVGVDFGLYHVELIYSNSGPCLVEVNGRMMGGVGPQVYQSLTGHDAFELLMRLHLGEEIQPDQRDIRGAATVVLIGAKDASHVSDAFTQHRLDILLRRYGITFCTLKLTPGMAVRRFDGNVSTLGHVIVPGYDPQISALKGHEFLLELEQLLGFDLSKYAPT